MPRSTAALVLAVAACQAPTWARTPEPEVAAVMPGPARGGARLDAPAHNDRCEGCHAEIAAEWRGSLHRRAYVDPEFARALAREPQPFCRGCHAPEADPKVRPPPALAALGVGCVTCHAPEGLPAGAVLAAAPRCAAPSGHARKDMCSGPARGGAPGAPHAVVASAAFAGPQACASCHEFDFPGRPGAPMQLTAREHAASRFAATSCADCHMPWVGGGAARHRSHAFAASRDPAVLRSALQVEATRRPGAVSLRLVPAAVGHAVPTGDLFRRLWVEAEAVDADGDPVGYDARALARRFERRRVSKLHSEQTEVADERPGAPDRREPDGAAVVELDLGPDADLHAVRWRVLYQRIEAHVGGEVMLGGEVELAAGALPPLPEES